MGEILELQRLADEYRMKQERMVARFEADQQFLNLQLKLIMDQYAYAMGALWYRAIIGDAFNGEATR